jgi:hypothetical protein
LWEQDNNKIPAHALHLIKPKQGSFSDFTISHLSIIAVAENRKKKRCSFGQR